MRSFRMPGLLLLFLSFGLFSGAFTSQAIFPIDFSIELEKIYPREKICSAQEILAHFSEKDQLNIADFLKAATFKNFGESFPKMSPSSLARFLKISASIYASQDTEKSDVLVVNQRPEENERLNRLLMEKTSDEHLASRYVTSNAGVIFWEPS